VGLSGSIKSEPDTYPLDSEIGAHHELHRRVSRLQVGDIIELPPDQAEMMVVYGWAERVDGLTPGAFPQTTQSNLGR
jgi:hypothetical protein